MTDTTAGAESEADDGDAPELDEELIAAVEDVDTSEAAASVAAAFETADDGDDDPPAATDAPDPDGSVDEEETISVLEFVLGDERYCLDITFIEQIVERGTVTRIPNAPDFVEGVIDLRGDITTVIDPMETLAADDDGDGDLIVVFDSTRMDDEWSVGWAVDGVRRVSTVSLSAVKESPVDEPWINGVVKRAEDGEFVIWTEPGELMRTDRGDAA